MWIQVWVLKTVWGFSFWTIEWIWNNWQVGFDNFARGMLN